MSCDNQKGLKCVIITLLLTIVITVVAIIIINIAIEEPATVGIQTELTVEEVGEVVPDGGNVLFNTVLNDQSDNITYDPATGEFTITEPGNYYVSWWFAADGAGPAANISMAVAVNGVPYSTVSSAIVSDQISGYALVTVEDVPATISLMNVTGEDMFIPVVPVQSGMVILELTNN